MEKNNIKKFTVRMPVSLYSRLKQLADTSYIPMAKLILIAVEEYLKSNQGD